MTIGIGYRSRWRGKGKVIHSFCWQTCGYQRARIAKPLIGRGFFSTLSERSRLRHEMARIGGRAEPGATAAGACVHASPGSRRRAPRHDLHGFSADRRRPRGQRRLAAGTRPSVEKKATGAKIAPVAGLSTDDVRKRVDINRIASPSR
ncbi:hypothetical protein GIY62_25715 [Burkholderia plantarii]|uniref:hypothetical protein n=1 Tax=Burkholderia plantarii TaxID=41899 RepID=UPI00272A42F8|nr:hypothetical protein [Burkholderia plantarii]WLE63668.1 hypothetical protein GIY62_25715 [Burkholderia plantarii]